VARERDEAGGSLESLLDAIARARRGDVAGEQNPGGEAAAAAAESDAEADRRKKTLGDALAAVSLHVAMASEAGEFTMRDVVLEAAREVRKRTRR
jgi:NTP pyrophosphatase (non-canonical NTP hydrolase)